MKVVDLINKLNEIGYDENTELTFSCVDGWYEIPFKEISYGGNLTGEPYHNNVIDIGVDVDSCEEYIKDKMHDVISNLCGELNEVIQKHEFLLI